MSPIEDAWDEARALVAVGDRDRLREELRAQDETQREAAVWGLGELGDPLDLPVLGALLADPHVGDAAEEALKRIGPAAETVLLTALDRPDGAGVLQALDALRAVGGASATSRLARCLREEDRHVRTWAVEALADIGGRGAPSAWEALREHAAREPDEDVRDLLAVVLSERPGDGA